MNSAQQHTTGKCPFAGENLEAATGVEPVMEVLQTSALPLGYAAPASTRRAEPPSTEGGETHPLRRKADDRALGFCPLPQAKEFWSG